MSSATLVVEGVCTAGTAVANLSSSTAVALVCRSDDGTTEASTAAGALSTRVGGTGIGGSSTGAEDTEDVCRSSATLVGGGAGAFAAVFVLFGAARTSRPSGPRYQHLRSEGCSSR